MRVARLKNVDLHWSEDGSREGYPIVFANSLGTDLRLWDRIIERLPGSYRFIRFDKRGHGLSSPSTRPLSIEELADDVLALLELLRIKKCIFVGLSIGGMIGQHLAAQRPDLINALVLSNTAAKMGNEEIWAERISAIEKQGLQGISTSVMERWFSPEFLLSDEIRAWQTMLTRTHQDSYIHCCQAIAKADLTETTRDLKLPTLGIAGDADGASPAELVRSTIDLVDGASFRLIDKAGHLPCVEQPEVFAGHLIDFLKEVPHG